MSTIHDIVRGKQRALSLEQQRLDRIKRYDPDQRFRPYRMVGTDTEWIAGAGCPVETGVVPMLLQLHADGEFDATDSVGVLDTGAWGRGNPGRWVLNPYPESRPTR